MWNLERPAMLFLLLLLPPLVYRIHFGGGRGAGIFFSFRTWNGDGFDAKAGVRSVIYRLSWSLFWIGFVLAVAAASGPVRIRRDVVYLTPGLDIMIVLDESPSMLAQDFKPLDRFETAKSVIRQFIEGRENDEIGIVAFAEEAVLRVPVTRDYPRLLDRLASLEVLGLGDGTAIGMGICLANLHLQAGDASGRIIILLTDGENNSGEIGPRQAATLASRLGIRIYSIGIGREGEAYMEVKDPETGRIITGTYVGRFDEELLQDISSQSGGRYFHASSPVALGAIFEQIDSLEKTEKRSRLEVRRESLFPGLLLAALLLILVDFFLRKAILREPF